MTVFKRCEHLPDPTWHHYKNAIVSLSSTSGICKPLQGRTTALKHLLWAPMHLFIMLFMKSGKKNPVQMIDYYLITTGFIACDKRISFGCITSHLEVKKKRKSRAS